MTSPNSVTLYHVTNRSAAEHMLESGIGLAVDDYAALYAKVKDYFNVPDEVLLEVMPQDCPETQGRVWFFTDLGDAQRHIRLASIGGLYKGQYLRALISACAAFMQVPFDSVEPVARTLSGELSEPVVVVLELPPDMTPHPSVYGGSSDVYLEKRELQGLVFKVQSLI